MSSRSDIGRQTFASDDHRMNHTLGQRRDVETPPRKLFSKLSENVPLAWDIGELLRVARTRAPIWVPRWWAVGG